ncbi:MAG: hypothetical protein GXP08_18715 [Gammaproteobacteria bacterium]|nr:hypothetical protein [Gammaproteobacteria bacterium]
MQNLELFFWIFAVLILICIFIAICTTFYLGRSKMKKVDLLVYGYEIPSDSIFFQGFRMMDYGGAFAWRFYARRIDKDWIREHFDKKFQRPFIISFWLIVLGFLAMILLYILDKLFLQIT